MTFARNGPISFRSGRAEQRENGQVGPLLIAGQVGISAPRLDAMAGDALGNVDGLSAFGACIILPHGNPQRRSSGRDPPKVPARRRLTDCRAV